MRSPKESYSGFPIGNSQYINKYYPKPSMIFIGKEKQEWLSAWNKRKVEKSAPWIYSKNIDVYKTPEVKDSIAEAIIDGMQEMIDEVGLNFSVTEKEMDVHTKKQLDSSTHMINRPYELQSLALRTALINDIDDKSPGYESAKAIIQHNKLNVPEHWAESLMNARYMAYAVTPQRANILNPETFWHTLGKHETSHLLGYDLHHNEYAVNGYAPAADCTCMPSATTRKTCPKCLDALVSLWQGVEERTGETFFK